MLLSKKKRMHLKERSRYIPIDPEKPEKTKKAHDIEYEFTDGFYSSSSDSESSGGEEDPCDNVGVENQLNNSESVLSQDAFK